MGDGPFFSAVQGFLMKIPLNITKSENLQMFCRGARNFFYNNKSTIWKLYL